MDVSIGVMAFNEEKNIGTLLRALIGQKTKTVCIKEIIVVSSGSTDGTNSIVQQFEKKHKIVKLLTQDMRKGKASAINIFLQSALSKVLVLESADTIPEQNAIERLCAPLKDEQIGVVASRPIPLEKNDTIINQIVHLQWKLHHQLSLKNPKCGELIAFRNIFSEIGNTAADEEFISMLIKEKGFRSYYASNAIVYSRTPSHSIDFIKQKRRIHWGHLELFYKHNYAAPSLDLSSKLLFLLTKIRFSDIFTLTLATLVELLARILAFYDMLVGKKHYVWSIVKSTKSTAIYNRKIKPLL